METSRKKGQSFLHVNVRSLVRHIEEVKIVVKKFDIVSITETWLNSKIPNEVLAVTGYNILRQDRVEGLHNCKKRGIVVYLKKEISVNANIVSEASTISDDIEQLWVAIRQPNHKPTLLGTVYRPPDGSVKLAIDSLNQSILVLDKLPPTTEVALVGDFNIDYRKTTNPDCRLLKEFERKYNLVQLIKEPTRVTNRVKSMIDLIFVNMNHVIATGVIPNMIADHFPTYFIKKKHRNSKSSFVTKGRMYKHCNAEAIQALVLADNRWYNFWQLSHDTTDMWRIMLETITDACDTLCPIGNIHIPEDIPNYVTADIKDLIQQKKTLSKLVADDNSIENCIALRDCRRALRKCLDRARRNHI